MKKPWRSLLLLSGLLWTCFYAGVVTASSRDSIAIMVRWPQAAVGSSPDPIFIYKRVKNPVTTDINGCNKYVTGNTDSTGLAGITSTNPSAQCYVWRQVGYLDKGSGWKSTNNISTNFAFIDS